MNSESMSKEKVPSLLQISVKDFPSKLPAEVIQYLAKEGLKYRRESIYIIAVSGLSNGGSEHNPISCYPNITLQELPYKIMNDPKLGGSGLFHALMNMHQDELKEKVDFRKTIQEIEDLDRVPIGLIQKLYLEILQKPNQLLIDMQDYNDHGTCFYYCFESDLYFRHLRKEMLIINPRHWLLSNSN